MAEIQMRFLFGNDNRWLHYVSHPNWSPERAQQSVDRLNRYAPKSREYRVLQLAPDAPQPAPGQGD